MKSNLWDKAVKMSFFAMLVFALLFAAPVAYAQETTESTETPEPAPVYKNEWIEDNTGWMYYDENGEAAKSAVVSVDGKNYLFDENGHILTGIQNASGKLYYFSTTGSAPSDGLGVMDTKGGWKTISSKYYYAENGGQLVTGWKTINKNKFYFKSNGQIATGFTNVGKDTYYFQPSGNVGTLGKMCTGWLLVKKQYYYLDNAGRMAKNTYVQGYQIKKDGKLSKTANELKKKVVKLAKKYKKNTKEKTLKACYNYVVKSFSYKRSYSFKKVPSWEMNYAYNMLKKKKGNCYSFAATFAFLAREIGYTNAKSIAGLTGARSGGWTPHGWVEIKMGKTTYVFDPEMQHAGHGNLYKFTYKKAKLRYKK